MAEPQGHNRDQGWRLAVPPRRLPPAANDNRLPTRLLLKRSLALVVIAALAAAIVAMKLG